MQNSRLQYLLSLCLQNTASEADREEFISMVSAPENKELASTLILQAFNTERETEGLLDSQQSEEILQSIILAHNIRTRNDSASPVTAHRIRFLKTAWFKYAAAILIICGIGAYLWTTNKKTDEALANGNKQLKTEIPPGSEKAVLTLADGTKIVLDHAANGNIAKQGAARIIKLANGQIAYDLHGVAGKDVVYNTMSTPAGGQYQVTLPDGTKVWLNASSSITFPAVFNGKSREVKIQGEIYFEVARNKEKPFVVDVDGKVNVEVLGTSFNINSYPDENVIKTTLVEGSVRVLNKSRNSVVLKPGYQAVVASLPAGKQGSDQQPKVTDANIAQIVAWKNGIFDFTGADLKAVMRQLERWYDIKVEYKSSASNMTFDGKMYRNVNLSDVLEVLQKMGVKFKMEGKTLIVL